MNAAPRQFRVSMRSGETLAVEQLATFTHYLGGEQFRFVVTRFPGEHTAQVTHRQSGLKACDIPHTTLAACRGNWADAGKLSFIRLVSDKGEARVASVLRAHEKATGAAS